MIPTIDWFLSIDSNKAANPVLKNRTSGTTAKASLMTLRDKVKVNLWFLTGESAQTTVRMNDETFALGAKLTSGLASPDVLFYNATFEEMGSAETGWFYQCLLNLNTVELIAAFGSSARSLATTVDIQVNGDDGEVYTLQFPLTVRRDALTGSEGPPEDAVPPYPAAPTANTVLAGSSDGLSWVKMTFAALADALAPEMEFAQINGDAGETFAASQFFIGEFGSALIDINNNGELNVVGPGGLAVLGSEFGSGNLFCEGDFTCNSDVRGYSFGSLDGTVLINSQASGGYPCIILGGYMYLNDQGNGNLNTDGQITAGSLTATNTAGAYGTFYPNDTYIGGGLYFDNALVIAGDFFLGDPSFSPAFYLDGGGMGTNVDFYVNGALTVGSGFPFQLGNDFTVGAVVPTGYLVIHDNGGNPYKIPAEAI